jgi:valyl-tRNA synthetase
MSEIHDWCISRQLWWGHRIPAYYCAACGKGAGDQDPQRLMASTENLEACPYCGGPVRQDPDVLDTWFSSQLWPFSTLGWPDETEDLRRYYPTTVMETGYDILFFWVARMIMAGLKFTGRPPFRDVFLHGLVRDAHGRKMSKTLGNVIDPLDLIDQYGADAVRFTLAILTVPGTDVPLDPKRMEGYRAFANKLWNAGRYVLMQLGDGAPQAPSEESLSLWDRWILAEHEEVTAKTGEALEGFRFYEAADLLYHFVWHRFCDWYVEVSKVGLAAQATPARREATRWVLWRVLDGSLRLLHPFMPFITEDLWQRLPGAEGSIMRASYPQGARAADGPALTDAVECLMDLVTRVRNLKAEKGLSPGQALDAAVVPADPAAGELASGKSRAEVITLARLKGLEIAASLPEGEDWIRGVSSRFQFAVRLHEGQRDLTAEVKRLEAELKRLLAERDKFASKLSNPAFVERAPADVVEKNRRILAEYERKARETEAALATLCR